MFARTYLGGFAECISKDNGLTWSEPVLSEVSAPSSRLYVEKLPSGRVLLIHNDHKTDRTNMTIKLSEDDGKSWKYSKCIDTRQDISYPDASYHNGKIYLTYDFGRTSEREILFTCFTEEDVITDKDIEITTVMGPEYVKAVKAPLSHIKLLAVGGIDENNMEAYLGAGVCGFGVGSNIIDKRMLQNSDYKGITKLAKKYTNVTKF